MAYTTPLLLLNFNRPEKTQELLQVLAEIRPATLYFAVDGPRPGHPADAAACEQVKQLAAQIPWPCTVHTLFQQKNLGCGLAPVQAISWLFEKEASGIILEDDCIPDPSFFPFAAELLERYQNDERIMQISGSNFLPQHTAWGSNSYFFSKMGSTWGWATWRRAWQKYNYYLPDYAQIRENGQLTGFFYNRKETAYVLDMLQQAHEQKPDVSWWDYQWDLTKHLHSGLSIVPATNLIKNKGFTAAATHTKQAMPFYEKLCLASLPFPLQHPRYVCPNHAYDREYFNMFHSRSLLQKISGKLSGFAKRTQTPAVLAKTP